MEGRAAQLEPERAHYAYVYAVALHSTGHGHDAIAVLKQNLARHPRDRETLLALISFHRDSGDIASALTYAAQLALVAPEDADVARLIEDLRSKGKEPVAR